MRMQVFLNDLAFQRRIICAYEQVPRDMVAVADPGPLMLGALERRTLVVNILIHTLQVQIRTLPHRSKKLNEHISLT